MTPEFAVERGLNVMSLDCLAEEAGGELPPINGLGGKFVKPDGFVLVNVRVPCVKGYNEDQIAIVLDDPAMKHCPVILRTPTLYRVMEVIREDEINRLAVPWAASHISWLMRGLTAFVEETPFEDVANRVVTPASVDEVVRVITRVQIPPFGHKIIHGRTGLWLQGCNMNVMTHGLEKRSPQLPLGVKVSNTYTTLATGSDRITVALRNTTSDWVQIDKGVPVARMVAANHILPLSDEITLVPVEARLTMSELERQTALLEKLDLSGLDGWEPAVVEQARSLLPEYHDIFSLEKHEIGKTKAVEHTITLKDPDTAPFKERFRQIPPPQVDEVREHLKLMLDAGAICPSNSPWCNAVVLVRKKDGSLRFCIDFRKLNALTCKDSHPLPRISETLDSLAGSAFYSTFDLTSGFWQVPMAEDSKQFTAFTLGSMGLFECDRMPFGLCNAPAMFQRLRQNCLGELNLTYCLIYLDDIIVYSKTPEEHLMQMRVVFECLREHGLKLKPSKCDLFKTEIIYLAHHMSKEGVKPSHRNVEAIMKCAPPKTYTEIRSFTGMVGYYRRFIKGFANIASLLFDLIRGDNKDKKSEAVTLTPEALTAFETLKERCIQAPVLTFPDFQKPFLLETDASGKDLGVVLSQKQDDGCYHPVAYASRTLNETEQRYHSNKQKFLALKWAVTEQFHEYLTPYGKNTNEFVVRTDNNPLTYIFSSARLDACGLWWVASLADYNFSLEYQRGKDNTVADFLSRVENHLTDEELEEYTIKIPQPGVEVVLNNAGTSITERAESGEDLQPIRACLAEALSAYPARLTTLHVTDWKQAQHDNPVINVVIKNLRAPHEAFKGALKRILDKQAI